MRRNLLIFQRLSNILQQSRRNPSDVSVAYHA
uniref:Proton-associated sugar transporter a-like protein n=1 Tax=Triatoma infestans TaxID=30076 RepID=A0A170YV23_TRIIF